MDQQTQNTLKYVGGGSMIAGAIAGAIGASSTVSQKAVASRKISETAAWVIYGLMAVVLICAILVLVSVSDDTEAHKWMLLIGFGLGALIFLGVFFWSIFAGPLQPGDQSSEMPVFFYFSPFHILMVAGLICLGVTEPWSFLNSSDNDGSGSKSKPKPKEPETDDDAQPNAPDSDAQASGAASAGDQAADSGATDDADADAQPKKKKHKKSGADDEAEAFDDGFGYYGYGSAPQGFASGRFF